MRRGMSIWAKLGLGCGVGCLVVVVVATIIGYVGVRYVLRKMNEFKTELVALGFEEQPARHVIDVYDEVTQPYLWIGQVVRVYGECRTNVAILAQMGEIHGMVEGDVYFRGQVLTISPKGHVKGNVDVKCQAVVRKGVVEGTIRGTWAEKQEER